MTRPHRNPCHGASLFLMLATVGMVGLLLSGLLHQVASLVRCTELAAVRTECRALAEGALEVARAQLANAPALENPFELEIAVFSGKCKVMAMPARPPGTYDVTAIGLQPYRLNQLASYEIRARLNTEQGQSVYDSISRRFVPKQASPSGA